MKKAILAVLVLLAATVSNAQTLKSFWKPIPKVQADTFKVIAPKTFKALKATSSDSVVADTVINIVITSPDNGYAFRPVVNVAASAFKDGKSYLMAGAGVSYQRLVYDNVNERWTTPWSVSALIYANGDLSPATPWDIAAIGISGTYKGVTMGVAHDFNFFGSSNKGFYLTAGYAISLNN